MTTELAPDSREGQPSTMPPAPPAAGEVLSTRDLFGEHREILIDHDGEMYRLRITRRNKLILQK